MKLPIKKVLRLVGRAAGAAAKVVVPAPVQMAARLARAATPRQAQQVRNTGIKLMTSAAATAAVSTTLPEVPGSWTETLRLVLQILTAIQAIIGLFITGIGQGQTNEVVR